MAKTWVLDTETKGTGAHVVPLDKASKRGAPEPGLATVEFKRPPRPPKAVEPPRPREFKVIDVMTQEVVADGAGMRETVDVLRRFRSVVDVLMFVWDPDGDRWRMLTLDEQRALWRHRDAATDV